MKSLRRGMNIFLLITVLTLFVVSNVAAAATNPASTTKLNLTYLINGMDLNHDQFNKTLKLTKEFLDQIDRSGQILLKLSASTTSKPMKTDTFVKITTEQYRFLAQMKLFRENLIKTIGEEKAEKIYTAIYATIPDYLLPEKAATAINNLSSSQADSMAGVMAMGDNKPGLEKIGGMDSEISGQMNSMDDMNMAGSMGMGMGNMGNMGSMPGMNSMNNNSTGSTGTGMTKDQLINQLQASNAMLTQMITALQSKGGLTETQSQLFLQLLSNQQALIRLLTTNPSK